MATLDLGSQRRLSLDVTFNQRKQLMQRFKEGNRVVHSSHLRTAREHKGNEGEGRPGRGQISEGFLGKGKTREVWILSVIGGH